MNKMTENDISKSMMKKILAIDDQYDNLISIKGFLTIFLPDCKLFLAQSGKEGLDIAQKEQPDTILLDIIMPEMDGFEVCERLKMDEQTKYIPIIMLSALGENQESRVKGLNLGADAFVSKPFVPTELQAQINVMLRIKEAEDKLRKEKLNLSIAVLDKTRILKKTNEELKQEIQERKYAEERLDQILNNSQEWIWEVDKNGLYTYSSPMSKEIINYKPKELVNKKYFYDFFHPSDKDQLKKQVFNAFKNKQPIKNLINRNITSDGKSIWLSTSGVPILDKDDNLLGYRGADINITDRYQTELALQESETRFRKYFEQGLIGMAITSIDKGFIEINDNFCEILGYSLEELSNISWEELTHPDDVESDLVLFEQLIACEIGSYSLEKRFVKKSGEIVFVAMSINAMHKDDGTVDYLLALVDDITERKLAEEALKSSEELYKNVFNNSPLGILHFNIEGIITDCNNEFLRILGSTKEKIVGLNMIKQLKDQEIIKAVKDTFINGSAYYNDYYTSVTGKNTTPVVIHFKAIYDLEEKIIGGIGMVEDITDRKLAEEALKASEELNRSITQSAADAILSMDQDGIVLSWNKAAEKIFGYSSKEMINNNLSLIIPDKFQEGHIAGVKRLEKGGRDKLIGRIIEITAIRKSGLEFPIELSLSSWASNNQKYFTGIIRDITQRKKAEEERKQSEERFKRLFDGLGDAVFVTLIGGDNKGKIIEVNTAAMAQTGYSREELLKMNIISDLCVANSGEINSEIWEERLLKGETVTTIEKKKKKDGTEYWTEVIVTHIDFKGEKASLSINHDITIRKRSEQIQKALYNISNAVIAKGNLEELIKFIQKELGKIIDTRNFYIALYDEKSDTLSLPFLVDEMEDRTNIPAGKTLTKYVINTQKSLLATKSRINELEESAHVGKFGAESEVWLGVPLKIDGKVTGALVVQSYTDVNAYTDSDVEMLEFVSDQISISIGRKKAHDDIIIALEKATESVRLKSAFLATISHELRTPLNAIIGFSDLINEEWPMSEIVGFAKTINESGIHLLSIVEEIFNITLIETGETTIDSKKENLHSIFADINMTVKLEQIKLKKDKIKLEQIINDDDKNLFIKTDVAKLKQILLNLLKNALKFTHEGYIKYGYAFVIQKNVKMLKFFVEDTGIGIPKDKQGFIFETFRQVEESLMRNYGGLGIGLSIAKKLTELLGGKIWFESTEGKGSTFYFTIPVESSDIADGQFQIQFDGEKKKILDVGAKHAKRTYLIVEDDEISYEFLEIVLNKPEVKILWAKNGIEAVDYCKSVPDISLVLMDINMQGMDGYYATREIKKIRPDLPIIAQTANAIAGDREKTIKAGCDDYISKPIGVEELLNKIEKFF